MAGLFDSLEFKCEECGANDDDSTQGYKVVEQKHLCPTCARRLAHAILTDVAKMAVKWPCAKHEKKEVELYCRQCQVAMCQTCALTVHSGHKMDDIWAYFAAKKKTVEKDIEVISARMKQAIGFQDLAEKSAGNVEKHFEDLRENLNRAFEIKAKDNDDKAQEEIEGVEKDAEEQIRMITEKRDSAIRDLKVSAESQKDNLLKNNQAVSLELKEIQDIVTSKTGTIRKQIETVLKDLEVAENVALTMLVDSDSKAFEERVAKLHKINLESLPELPNEDALDNVSDIARKLRFKRVHYADRVGYISGKHTSYEMVKSIPVPEDIKEPFLVCAIDAGRVGVRDGKGTTLVAISLESGDADTILEPDPKRGIWDAVFLAGNRCAYSDFNSGQISICNINGEQEFALSFPNDGSRFAYLSTDEKGELVAGSHVDATIHIIESTTGKKLRTISNIDCKQILDLHSFHNGDLVVRSTNTNVLVLDRSTGAIKTNLSLADWNNRINIHVGADDFIYVIYRNGTGRDYTGSIGVVSSDGVMRRQNFIEFPTSFLYRYRPRCVVPSSGTVVILNGCVLLVYKEKPGVDSLLDQ